MNKTASKPAPRTSFYIAPIDFEGDYVSLGNRLVSCVCVSGIVSADGVDREAISRSLEGNSLADNIKPDRMLGGVPTSKRGVHVSKSTSEARNRS